MERKYCPNCNRLLPPDSTMGLCPECLIQSGFMSGAESREKETAGAMLSPLSVEKLKPLFPQLEILELVGQGGMGAVYKARQPRLNRLAALKILSNSRNDSPRFAERFEREAQALAQFNHPNIVTVYDFGETDGLFYLVMEYVDGLNLRQLQRTRKITPEEALAIVPPICDALQYAHEHRIVHRDIKPENILVDKAGHVKIADFGIAKILAGGTEQESLEPLTGEQQAVGTPHYMAPEQIEKPNTVDHRADIYALGVVFYEMLTGELPLGKFAPPSHKVQIDVRLDEVIMRALEKEPELRYQNASEVRTQVETITATAQGQPVEMKKSDYLRSLESLFSFTFTAPLAGTVANSSALGFLGFLGFLGYATIPPTRALFSLHGLFGFFGLIGLAFMIEFAFRASRGGGSMSRAGKHSGRPSAALPLHYIAPMQVAGLAFASLAFAIAAVSHALDHKGIHVLSSLIASGGFGFAAVRLWYWHHRLPNGNPPDSVSHRDASGVERQKTKLWYGFVVSIVGLPLGIAMNLPIVMVLAIAGLLIAGYRLYRL